MKLLYKKYFKISEINNAIPKNNYYPRATARKGFIMFTYYVDGR